MRRWRAALFILAAPVLALLAVELGLRAAGLAWTAWYRASSRPETFPVYVVGESTAFGEPFAPKITFPKIVALMFGGRIRGRPLEIVNLARPGSQTEEQYWRLFRELSLRPRREGLVLIYIGINETYPDSPPSWLARSLDRSLILSRILYLIRSRRGAHRALDYERRLAKLAALARGRGLPVVISTLVGNVRDFAPDVRGDRLDDPGRRGIERAGRLERLGRWRTAAGIYEDLLRRNGADAGLLHHLAVCRLRSGRTAEARALFRQAVDLGGTERPTTEQELAIRRVAGGSGAALSDSRALFEAASPLALPGYDLFTDVCHPNVRGYLLIAGGFSRQIAKLLNIPIVRPRLSESDLAAESGFSADDELGVYRSRVMWSFGEASCRTDREPVLKLCEHYIGLVERKSGHEAVVYRFVLALLAHDESAGRYWLSRKGLLYRDRDALTAIVHTPGWLAQTVADAGLPKTLAREAQRLMVYGVGLSQRGSRPAAEGDRSPARRSGRRRYAWSKLYADRGVEAALSGHRALGLLELRAALAIDPDNAEAAYSLCTFYFQQGRPAEALRYCEQAVRGAAESGRSYPPDFLSLCRSARDEARSIPR